MESTESHLVKTFRHESEVVIMTKTAMMQCRS
jgi:hypothetical protein